MRGISAVLLAVALACSAGRAACGEDMPATFDFRIVERIELACRIGVEKAGSAEEALSSLRWRNGALTAIVEIAYQATLAWLSERPGLADRLEDGQGRWLDELEAMPGGTRAELEAVGEFLHRRLAVFMTIAGKGAGEAPPP